MDRQGVTSVTSGSLHGALTSDRQEEGQQLPDGACLEELPYISPPRELHALRTRADFFFSRTNQSNMFESIKVWDEHTKTAYKSNAPKGPPSSAPHTALRLHPSTHSTSAKSSERPSAPRISCNMMHRLQPSVIRHRIALSSSSSLLPTLLVGPRPMLHTRHQANRAAPDLKGDAATSADNGGVPEEGQGAPPPSESRTASPSEAAATAAASAVAGAEDYFGAQVRPYGPAGNPDAVHAAWHWVTGAGTHANRHAQQ